MRNERRKTERRRKWSLRWPERRSGFDRRLPEKAFARWFQTALLGLRDSKALPGILLAINGLNLADLALSFKLFGLGAAEGNPILAGLLAESVVSMVCLKLIVVAAVTLVIWRNRRYRSCLLLSTGAVASFTALITYELGLLAYINFLPV